MTKHSVIEQGRAPCAALSFFPGAEPWNDSNTGENQGAGPVLDSGAQKPATDAWRWIQKEVHANRLATMGQLTASLAHEVSQPLGATMTNAQAALRWLGADQPNLMEAREALSRIVRDISRASAIVSQIRGLGRKTPPREDWVDLNSTIRDVIDMTRTEAIESAVSVRADLAEGLPFVQGNQVELQQVILNLIVNAIEAMREMSKGVRELLIVTATTEADDVLVSVCDTGPGLAPATIKNLFKAFHTTKPNGLGLGLSICRTIVETHEGELWAKTDALRGAIFQFTLPARRNGFV
jgi:C4-dicarboxylate-specific signal transduction histidine kinase